MEEEEDDEMDTNGLRRDLHALRERDAALDALCEEIQKSAAASAAEEFAEEEMKALRGVLHGRLRVLVTGSAGYLGSALYLTLQRLGVPVVGIDVVRGKEDMATVDVVADIADVDAMRRCGADCGAIFHCAALHAPHATSWHRRDFMSTNVHGTENLLSLGLPLVFTSTTSLTISARVKARERAGELVWLDERSQRPDIDAGDTQYDETLDAPRNKYGYTKMLAEQRCLSAMSAPVVVLRTPRFFPEDVHESRDSSTSLLANIKANELLGRRCALVDIISAHLSALARIKQLHGSLFTLAPPWPLRCGRPGSGCCSARDAAAALRSHFPHAEDIFAKHGWRLPDAITRVYDCSAAQLKLGWRPRVTFESLLQVLMENETVADRLHRQRLFDAVLRGAY